MRSQLISPSDIEYHARRWAEADDYKAHPLVRFHHDQRGQIAPPRTASPAQRKKKQRAGGDGAAAIALVPFGAAAHEHTEPFIDTTFTPGASSQAIAVPDVPSFGFLRGLWLEFEATGGVAGTAVADYPFSIIDSLSLGDTNGAALYGSLAGGYNDFLANLYGGYDFQQDPRSDADYTAADVNFRFALRVPVEIHHSTGLGCLANQNASSTYKLGLRAAPLASAWSVNPSTIPTVRVRGYLEAWTLPDATDRAGRPQAQLPPLHGTSQFWTVQGPISVAAGAQTVRLTRMGSLLRTLIFVFRDGTGARAANVIPDQPELWWDDRQFKSEHKRYRRHKMSRQYVHAAAGVPAGVLAYTFDHDVLGHGGDGTPELWIPTMQSTRFELRGTFPNAGTVTILTNDIAPVEVDPTRRYVETSETGFEPAT